MGAIVTDRLRHYNADQFIEGFTEASTSSVFYLTIGRSDPWADDATPPTPTFSIQDIYTFWDQMIAAKKVVISSVSRVIARRDWTTGTLYAMYDSSSSILLTSNFYVLTDDSNVYKCLSNNNGALSTSKPTGTGTANIQTADGYIWKYMYTITGGDALRFATASWMPVATNSTVAAAAVDGAVEFIKVTNGGSGYTTAPTVSISGDGTGATATASILSGAVVGITITNKGSGYTSITIGFSGGGGTGAVATASITPPGGHGSNAPYELGGYNVMMNVLLQGEDGGGDFPVDDDYRQIGLIRDPLTSGSSPATDTTYAVSELERASGEILFIENRRPIVRAADQNEDIKLILTF